HFSTPREILDPYASVDDPEALAQCRRLARLLISDLVFHRVIAAAIDHDAARFLGLCRTRGLQLRLALLLFQQRHGRPAKDLEELVPALLPAVPVDPFAEKPFKYRLIDADEWVSWPEDVRLNEGGDWSVEAALGPGGGPAGSARRAPARYDSSATHRRLHAG